MAWSFSEPARSRRARNVSGPAGNVRAARETFRVPPGPKTFGPRRFAALRAAREQSFKANVSDRWEDETTRAARDTFRVKTRIYLHLNLATSQSLVI